MEGILVPLGLFAGLTIVLGLAFWFKYRGRSDMQTTIRTAIEQGQELTPEIVERLGHQPRSKDQDLRNALVWLSLAAALALCGFFVPDPSGYALKGCLAGAAFPLCIGLAYLIMWRFTERKQ